MAPRPLIANQFSRLSEEDWRALAAHSIGVPSIEDLASKTEDGLIVAPIYRRGGEAAIPGRGARSWTVVQRIDDPDPGSAVAAMAADAAGGAGGVELVFARSAIARGRGLSSSYADLPPLIAAVPALPIRIDAGEDTARIATSILDHFAGKAFPAALTASFDPIATLAACGFLVRPLDEIAAETAGLLAAFDAAGIAGAVAIADGRPWHDGGASDVDELAVVLAAFVSHLRGLGEHGVAPAAAAKRLGVALAADADQFLTIAKFRAVRLLLDRILDVLDVGGVSPPVHAETAWRMMGRGDPAANMLRATSAVFAAGVGGADSITVLPHSLDEADTFARRMARNTQTILVEESGLARVADPGAGSGAVEALTDQLAAAAWESFRAIEAGGGLLAAVRAGTIQRTVAASRDDRLRRVATRATELIGINVHCAPADGRGMPRLPSPRPVAIPERPAETAPALTATRLAEAYEVAAIRSAALSNDGRPPTCLVVTVGAARDAEPAVALVRDILASGGVAPVEVTGLDSPDSAAAALERARTPAACLCAGAGVDDGELVATAAMLASGGARHILLAGGKAPRQGVPAPFDRVIGAGSDIPALLFDLLDAIAGAAEKEQNR